MNKYIRRQDALEVVCNLLFEWRDKPTRNNMGSCEVALADALCALEKLPTVVFQCNGAIMKGED